MFRRQTVVFALAGVAAAAFLAVASQSAQALTIENYGGASDARSGWADLNYTDPNKKPSRDGDKRTLDNSGPRVFFGPANSANQNFNPNQYFQPNYLMGK